MDDTKTTPSYHKQEDNILGCKHYPRNCRIKAVCCEKLYVCRLCHNENEKHEINRFATKEVQCMKCYTIQPVSSSCMNIQGCGISFARYYCAHCKFFDDTPGKDLFHCLDCGICRVGKREDYIHCKRCVGCLGAKGFDKHKCIENKFLDQCPICMEDLFSSRVGVTTLTCGHPLHTECWDEFCKNGQINCPICKKSAFSLDKYWVRVKKQIDRSPMPKMYEGSTCSILCNDCGKKSIDIPFHFLGNQCTECNSFNTTITSKNIQINEAAERQDIQQYFNDLNNNNNNNDDNDEDDLDDDDLDSEELEDLESEEDNDENEGGEVMDNNPDTVNQQQ